MTEKWTIEYRDDKLSTFKRHLKSHMFKCAFSVLSPCASASDSYLPRGAMLAQYMLLSCVCHSRLQSHDIGQNVGSVIFKYNT